MKRALRILIIGPIMVFGFMLFVAMIPVVRFLDWLMDVDLPRQESIRELWNDLVMETIR